MLTINALKNERFGPIDLILKQGECICIKGPSGAGKSQMLRAIVDLDPNEGEINLSGKGRRETSADLWRTQVAYVPAESGWWADTVRDHFSQPGLTTLTDLISAAGLPSEVLDWSVDRLSSGERHRLALVRAFCVNPSVLLLDEPTATLDSTSTEHIETLLLQRLTTGVSAIVVTHDDEQPARLNSQLYTMQAGTLTQDTR